MCEIRTFGWVFRPHFIPQNETKNPQNVRVFAQVGGFLTLPLCASISCHNHRFTMECPYLGKFLGAGLQVSPPTDIDFFVI